MKTTILAMFLGLSVVGCGRDVSDIVVGPSAPTGPSNDPSCVDRRDPSCLPTVQPTPPPPEVIADLAQAPVDAGTDDAKPCDDDKDHHEHEHENE